MSLCVAPGLVDGMPRAQGAEKIEELKSRLAFLGAPVGEAETAEYVGVERGLFFFLRPGGVLF